MIKIHEIFAVIFFCSGVNAATVTIKECATLLIPCQGNNLLGYEFETDGISVLPFNSSTNIPFALNSAAMVQGASSANDSNFFGGLGSNVEAFSRFSSSLFIDIDYFETFASTPQVTNVRIGSYLSCRTGTAIQETQILNGLTIFQDGSACDVEPLQVQRGASNFQLNSINTYELHEIIQLGPSNSANVGTSITFVPEPSTWSSFGSALIGLISLSSRRMIAQIVG